MGSIVQYSTMKIQIYVSLSLLSLTLCDYPLPHHSIRRVDHYPQHPHHLGHRLPHRPPVPARAVRHIPHLNNPTQGDLQPGGVEEKVTETASHACKDPGPPQKASLLQSNPASCGPQLYLPGCRADAWLREVRRSRDCEEWPDNRVTIPETE